MTGSKFLIAGLGANLGHCVGIGAMFATKPAGVVRVVVVLVVVVLVVVVLVVVVLVVVAAVVLVVVAAVVLVVGVAQTIPATATQTNTVNIEFISKGTCDLGMKIYDNCFPIFRSTDT